MKKAVATTRWSASALPAHEEHGFVHPTAVLDPSVQLGENVSINANVVIERNVKIGSNTVIHSGCYIGEDCQIGAGTILYPFVTLREKSRLGNNVNVGSGVVIGSDGFGYAKEQNGINYKVPQVGYVKVEDDVTIGPNTTIDRATLGMTVIGKGAEIGSLVQVGHNVTIGDASTVGNGVGICGSCKIGNDVSVGHGVGLVGHIHVGDHSKVDSGSGVSKDVRNGTTIMGSPAMEEKQYSFYQSFILKLPELAKKIADLEKLLNKK